MNDKNVVKNILGSDVTMTVGVNTIVIKCPYVQKNACAVYDYAYQFPEALTPKLCRHNSDKQNVIKIRCHAVSVNRIADYLEDFCKDCITKSRVRERIRDGLGKQQSR